MFLCVCRGHGETGEDGEVGLTAEKLVKMVKWWGNTTYIIYDYNYYVPFRPSSSTLLYSQETLYSISYIYIYRYSLHLLHNTLLCTPFYQIRLEIKW
jgi:hypothetical protein